MPGTTLRRIALLLGLAAVAVAGRVAPAGTALSMGAAALALLALPGYWLAGHLRPGDSHVRRAALGLAAAHGAFALLVLAAHFGKLPLGALLAPLSLFAIASAFLRGGRGGPEGSGREAAALLALGLLLVLAVPARTGFRTDAYDHIGGARWMIRTGDVLPHEYFHAERADRIDPRKGTNHTFFALLCLVAGRDPEEGWKFFQAWNLLFLLAAFHTLARSALPGGAAPWTATAAFAMLHRGGPGGQWFATAGYPGEAGYAIFLCAVAVALSAAGRRERSHPAWPVLLGAGAVGIHIFHGVLTGLALGTLFLALLCLRPYRSEAAPLARTMAFFAAGCAPLLVFRLAVAYHPANPLHLHPQGLFLLPAGLSILEYKELARSFGLAGWLSLPLLPFVRPHGRPMEPGEAFLVAAWAVTLFLLVNPVLFPLLADRLGYLMRRFTLLVPWPLIVGAVVGRFFHERFSLRAAAPAAVALAGVLLSFGSSVAARGPAPAYSSPRADPDGAPMAAALREVAAALPVGATVLTDPVTGYVMYGRTLLHPVAVIDQHSSPNDPTAGRRIVESQRALHPRWGAGRCDATLERYGVSHVLIDERFDNAIRTWNAQVDPETVRAGRFLFDARPDRFCPLPAPEGMHLYEVIGTGGAATAPPIVKTERPGGAPLDREMPGGLTLETASPARQTARAGELVSLTLSWRVTGADERFIPMRLLWRGVPADAERKGWAKPWRTELLGGDDLPYLLWRMGERVVLEHRVRVPATAKPGEYALILKLEPFAFFRVRALRELGPSADLSDWTEVASVEVRP